MAWEDFMQRARGDRPAGSLTVDDDTPADAVGMRVIDDAMSPDIARGETIVVSRTLTPQPNDYVIAQVGNGPHLLRKYVPRGADRQGRQVFDLLSTSADFSTITCNSSNPGKVLAVVIAHVRRLRRE